MLAAARTVVAFGVVLQVAGFVKLLVIANYFGAGPALDAYFLGCVIPTFLVGVSGGILQTGFVPGYVSALARGEEAAAHTLGNITLTWTVIVVSAVALLLTLMRGQVVPLLAHGVTPDTRRDLMEAFVVLMWTAPINAVADAGALLLNAQGRFSAAAAAPLLNAVVGTLVLILLGGVGVSSLVWSLVAGLVVQAAVVMVAIRRAGVRLRPRLRLPANLPRLLGTVAVPVVLSMVLGNFVPAFVQAVSARAGPGAISAMGYAMRLHNSLVQAVVMSVSAVLLPHFARVLASGRNDELRRTLERVFAAALMFAAGALALIGAGGPLIVRVLLQRGHFEARDADLVAQVWLALSVGLLGATWGIFLARLFQAQQKLWFIFALGCLSVAANVTLAFALLPLLGVTGVALANSIVYTIIMILCHLRADRVLGRVLGASSLAFIVRTAIANLGAYVVALWLAQMLASVSPLAAIASQALVVAAANLLVARTAPLRLTLRAMFGFGA